MGKKKGEKWEEFLSRAMVGNIGDCVKNAIMAQSPNREDMEIVIKAAVEFGSLHDNEIVEQYGPSPFPN